jgi:hypothetical protein
MDICRASISHRHTRPPAVPQAAPPAGRLCILLGLRAWVVFALPLLLLVGCGQPEELPAISVLGGSFANRALNAEDEVAEVNLEGAHVALVYQRMVVDDERGGRAEWLTQSVSVSGDFPNAFSIDLEAVPPVDAIWQQRGPDPHAGYATAKLVVLAADAPAGQQVATDWWGNADARGEMRVDEAEALGIVSIAPVHVTFSGGVCTLGGACVIDGNFSSEATLAPGFHVGRFDGAIANADHAYYQCVGNDHFDHDCGERPYDQLTDEEQEAYFQRLEDGDTLSFEIGGEEDLMHSLLPSP